MISYYATLNATIPRKKQKYHEEDAGFVLSLRIMLGFFTRGGGGVGAESGRGLRILTAPEPGVGVDAGAGDAEEVNEDGVWANIEFWDGEGRDAGWL